MSQSEALVIDHVHKTYFVNGEPLNVLADISLTIERGSFTSFVGASGCGKSTLLRLLIGLEQADQGAVTLDGVPITGPDLERGIVFQDPRLLPWLTVEQNIAFGLINAGLSEVEVRERVRHHVALVRLEGFENALPRQLSGGMAQRVAIARALANRPRVLLLDEPFGALDALTRSHLQDQLLEVWQRERITTVFVTHDVEEAIYLSDRVVVLEPRPGRVRSVIDLDLARPRSRTDPAFAAHRDAILRDLVGSATPLSRAA